MFLRGLFGLICVCAALATGAASEESITDLEIPFAEVISHDLTPEISVPPVEHLEANGVNREEKLVTVETDVHGEIHTGTTSSISQEDNSIRQAPAVDQASVFEAQLAEKEAEFQSLHLLYQQITKETEMNQVELNEARNKLIAYLEADITKNNAHSEEINRLNSHKGDIIRENENLRADLDGLRKRAQDTSAMMETEVARNQELQNELSVSRESVQQLTEAALASENRTLISSSQQVMDGALSFFLLTCKALKNTSKDAYQAVAKALNLPVADETDRASGADSPLSQVVGMVEVATAMSAVYYVAGSEHVASGIDAVAQFYHNTLFPVFHDTVVPQVTGVWSTVTTECTSYYNQAAAAYTSSVHPPIAEFYEANLAAHVNAATKSAGDFYNENVKEHYDLHAAPVLKTIVDTTRLTFSTAHDSIQKVDLKRLAAQAMESVTSVYQSALVYHRGLVDSVLGNKDFRDVFGGQANNASAVLVNSIIAVVACYLVQFLRNLLRATGVIPSKAGKTKVVVVNSKPTDKAADATAGNSTSHLDAKKGPPKNNGKPYAGIPLHAAPPVKK